MANCLKSLRQELEQTKIELIKLKSRDYDKHPFDPHLEDLIFVENATKIEIATKNEESEDAEDAEELQKKRYVTFASPPSLTRTIADHDNRSEVQETSPVQKKPKKKPLMPLVGRILNFSRKRGSKHY